MASAEEIFKYTIFGGIIAFLVFVGMQFWSHYDLHIWLIKWIKGWSRTTKINTSWALAIFLIAGTWYSIRNLRRNVANMTMYDR
jgi:hypothetical protein